MPFVKPAWLSSLSFKVLLAYLIGVVLSILLMTLVTLWLMVYQSGFVSGADVGELTKEMAGKLRFDEAGRPTGFTADRDDLAWVYDSLKQETAYRVLDEAGQTALVSVAGDAFWQPDDATRKRQLGHFEFERDGLLVHGATAVVVHEGQTWYLQFAVSARFFQLMHHGFALPFMGVGIILFSLVLLFVFGISTYITLGHTLKPLRQVSEAAAAISPRSLHARLAVERVPSEITPLVNSFNQVLDRLEQGYTSQREFLATAAHELKTPLALIRAQIEVEDKNELRMALLNDVTHMARQVQQLLLLAEVSEVQNYQVTDVDVSDVASEVIRYLKPMAEAGTVQLMLEHDPGVIWRADRAALFTLLKNLLENAIQHAPEHTQVQISITAEQLQIRDWGPGVSEDQLPRLFVRFWRGAHRRDHGAGLGLAICQEIAQAQGWTLSAHRGKPGLCFQLSCGVADARS